MDLGGYVCLDVGMYVCRHVGMYVCMYACLPPVGGYVGVCGMYVCMHACRQAGMQVGRNVCRQVCIYQSSYLCRQAGMYEGMNTCRQGFMFVCLYVSLAVCLYGGWIPWGEQVASGLDHIHIYIYIHAYPYQYLSMQFNGPGLPSSFLALHFPAGCPKSQLLGSPSAFQANDLGICQANIGSGSVQASESQWCRTLASQHALPTAEPPQTALSKISQCSPGWLQTA